MAQFSLRRNSKQKPQKNDDIYEVMMLANENGIVINPAIGTTIPSQFATLNNFGISGVTPFSVEDDYIPVFALRVKPDTNTVFRLINFNIVLDAGSTSILGYRWHMNPTLGSAYSWSDLGSTNIQYVEFDDVDGTPNEITSNTEVHSRAITSNFLGGNQTSLTPEMKQFPFTAGGIEMFLEIRRIDGTGAEDFWYDMTMAID